MADKRDPSIVALEAIYAALKDLDADSRRKVLSSAFALLGLEGTPLPNTLPQPSTYIQHNVTPALPQSSSRPVSLVELIQEKKPSSNVQCIAVFAYYREKFEGQPRFSRGDLQGYFSKAKLTPAANYDRDFTGAVRNAWIHEDGAESYLTTKGIEAVENGFEGNARTTAPRATVRKKKRL